MDNEIENRAITKRKRRYFLGEMLLETEVITKKQLDEALEIQLKTGERIGNTLKNLGYVTEDGLLETLSQQLGIPRINLADIKELPSEVLSLVPEFLIRRHNLIPILLNDTNLTIAMSDPLDIFAIDDVALFIGDYRINPVIAFEDDIRKTIDKYYGENIIDMEKTADKIQVKAVESVDETIDLTKITSAAGEAPLVNLVNHIILKAIQTGASDIHIEPYEYKIRIRNRIDGILYELPSPPKKLLLPIVSRIKIMSNADITEHRRAQDSRAKVVVGNREVDLRISFIPTVFGERVTIRILDPRSIYLDLTKLGFDEDNLKIYQKNINCPYGIILVTGPTGSGKTTTLYSTLATLNSIEKNIMTVEDPIEYILPGINQQQVNPDLGVTFASGLRSFLRQDPDIIMVGEIRDKETAETAIHAALTGHLVFSTLHTNDAPSAIPRLVSMDIVPFLVSSALTMIIAQRLLRVLCHKCKEPYQISTTVLKEMELPIEDKEEKVTLYRGVGCEHCYQTGYHGRIGIYEVMPIDDNIKDLILKTIYAGDIEEAAHKAGMKSLKKTGMARVLSGVTSLEEYLRVV
ncbi:MAG: ATPase, T2SS/T4P/T4SS family [Nitrospirota bacterium]